METKEIIEMLKEKQQELWEKLQQNKLVFGEDSEATLRAKVRWGTTADILSSIINNIINKSK